MDIESTIGIITVIIIATAANRDLAARNVESEARDEESRAFF